MTWPHARDAAAGDGGDAGGVLVLGTESLHLAVVCKDRVPPHLEGAKGVTVSAEAAQAAEYRGPCATEGYINLERRKKEI